jgi:serine/threonine protein kinase
MRTGLAAVRDVGGLDSVDRAVRRLEDEWNHGEPTLERHWAHHDPAGSMSVLAALIKVDLRCRYVRGERPTIADYLRRFPDLGEHGDRVISLVYEEFCLLEELGEHPDTVQFCARYAPWRDSLESQLRYHHQLSQAIGPPPPPRFPALGDYFEEFQLREVLGQGGAARVYLARDESLGGREVALKVSPDRGQEPAIHGRLDHAHIVPVLSVVFQPDTGLRGLCMPYRRGLPLDKVIRKVQPAARPRSARVVWDAVASEFAGAEATPRDQPGWITFPFHGAYADAAAWIVATLARALAYAHALKIVHRDVKPANVLLTLRDGPQVLDFNLAHDPHCADQAEAAMRGGTLPYMAPEQLEAFLDPSRWDDVGPAADLYALGLLCRELLTGEPPDTPDATLSLPRALRALLDRRAVAQVALRRINPTIPHALEAIVTRCLAFDPSARYPSASALADDLENVLARRPLRHVTNPSATERLDNWTRRNWLALGLGAAVCALPAAIPSVRRSVRSVVFPIEENEEFRAAVRAVDYSDYEQAVEPLESLAKVSYPDSPLARFYLGLALYGSIGLAQPEPPRQPNLTTADQAGVACARALNHQRIDADLAAWAQREPHLARHAESLGIALWHDNQKQLARRALAISLGLDPKRTWALYFDAQLDCYDATTQDRFEDKYRSACETMTRLIRSAEERNAPTDRENLVRWYRSRARILTDWGLRLENSSSRMGPGDARRHFTAALDDLKRGNALHHEHDRKQRYDYDLIKSEALIGLGDVAFRLGRHDDAARSYHEAEAILRNLEAPVDTDPRNRVKHKDLIKKIGECLSQITPTSTATPPARSDPPRGS